MALNQAMLSMVLLASCTGVRRVAMSTSASAPGALPQQRQHGPAPGRLPSLSRLQRGVRPRVAMCTSAGAPAPVAAADEAHGRRVPLCAIFNRERDFLFSTRKNMRRYEWGDDEVESLWSDLNEQLADGGEFELGQVIVFKEEQTTNGTLFEVHDGQQRLVTLCLLYAAIRDRFLAIAADPSVADADQAEAREEAAEISLKLRPKRIKRYTDVVRVQLRHSDGPAFERILRGADAEVDTAPPAAGRLNGAVAAGGAVEQRVLANFAYFAKRMAARSREEMVRLHELLDDRMFLFLSQPTTVRIARQLVLSQNKGKDLEPIDIFKATVAFSTGLPEDEQDELLERFDRLMVEHSRKTVADACLLLAQAELRKKMKRGGDVDFLDEYWRVRRMSGVGPTELFEQHVCAAVAALRDFREGGVELVSGAGGPAPSLAFLRRLMTVTGAQELEAVVLELQLTVRDGAALRRQLFGLERLALSTALANPPLPVASRWARAFEIVRELREDGEATRSLELGEEAEGRVLLELGGEALGSTKKKLATAVLLRLNEHELLARNDVRIEPVANTLTLEHVLPQKEGAEWREAWPSEAERIEWLHKLGNLVLLNHKMNALASNKQFHIKREQIMGSPFPLTNGVGDLGKWTAAEARERHELLLDLAARVWHLPRPRQSAFDPASVLPMSRAASL